MNIFFIFHGFSGNMRARIATFSLKGKENISWEYVNNFRSIQEEDLARSEFERLFRKKYLSKRYNDDREKQFYEMKMGSMTNDKYTSLFLELLRYVCYIKEEGVKIQRFINGFLISFKYKIEFDEPISLVESIRKLKH